MHDVGETSHLNHPPQRRLLISFAQDEQRRRHPLSKQRERVDQKRIVLRFCQAARCHDDRRFPERLNRPIDRLLRRGGYRREIDRVGHHVHARRRCAERVHQILGDSP
ncbi:MAG: hypothetical protein DMF97_11465 [Acidobacteria bacterium]|nr:MAG: hypothetical protein DMF97_11465 [Acidobacteriota bacterium]